MQYIKVANLNIRINGADYKETSDIFKKYESSESGGVDSVFSFAQNDDLGFLPDGCFAKADGRYYYEFGEKIGFYDFIDELGRCVTYAEADRNFKNVSYEYNDMEKMFKIKTGEALSNVCGRLFRSLILHHGGIVLHASTIVYKGRAIAFCAPSGTGKSTHTSLWTKYYPDCVNINDDSPAVRYTDGKFYAFGTPWSGKSVINENLSAPLAAVVFLERADKCSVSEILPIEGFLRMLKELPLSVFKSQSDLQIDIMNRIFKEIPSYLLKCDISKTAVDTVLNKLF